MNFTKSDKVWNYIIFFHEFSLQIIYFFLQQRYEIIIILLMWRCVMTEYLKMIFYNSFELVSQVTQNFIFDLV